MTFFGRTEPGPLSLRHALATVHRDQFWWLHCGGYGLAALVGLGLPLAAGFVMESLDNSRRGFASPLPPPGNVTVRSLTGLFAMLIDFAFLILPILIGTMLLFATGIVMLLAGITDETIIQRATASVVFGTGMVVVLLFLSSVAPAGRLRFAREGHIEDALRSATLNWTLERANRRTFLQARLRSLVAYLPAALLSTLTLMLARIAFPGQIIVLGLGLWLILSAIIYAHLVVVQLYVSAERLINEFAQ
ncbi:DUF4013 domain-containing protein [Candidatus Chloroploca sp. Khr17]|uniref:DUF4013 domain-containing protein n=1 Tax=Candidatus Chloroploca sp. Khr17 TaxID=2496869 RepID=UPI00101CBC76|nr:DUF4013 domain-containing protein [Candidatus Chloroploca sp. Khr17]